MSPTRPLPDDDETAAELRQATTLLRTVADREAAVEEARADLDRLVCGLSRKASLGALAQALGVSRPGVQKMVRRGKMREEKP